MMTAIATALRTVAGWVVAPAVQLGSLTAILVLGVVAGVFVITVFRYVANEDALRRAKDQIHSALLGIVLFRHDTAAMMRHEWRLVRGSLTYMKGGFKPLAVIIIPMMALIGQMGLYYAYRPLQPNEQTMLTVTATPDGWDEVAQASLEPTGGITIETPALRIPQNREVCWRLRAISSGDGVLAIKTASQAHEKKFAAGPHAAKKPVSPVRVHSGFFETLFESDEPRLADGGIQSVRVEYPAATIPIAGLQLHWLVPFLAAALATGLILKHYWGVEV